MFKRPDNDKDVNIDALYAKINDLFGVIDHLALSMTDDSTYHQTWALYHMERVTQGGDPKKAEVFTERVVNLIGLVNENSNG